MARSSEKEVWNKKERKEMKEGDLRSRLFVISTQWGFAVSLRLLFFSFFFPFYSSFRAIFTTCIPGRS